MLLTRLDNTQSINSVRWMSQGREQMIDDVMNTSERWKIVSRVEYECIGQLNITQGINLIRWTSQGGEQMTNDLKNTRLVFNDRCDDSIFNFTQSRLIDGGLTRSNESFKTLDLSQEARAESMQ